MIELAHEFQHAFHQGLAIDAWMRQLAAAVEARVLAAGDLRAKSGSGTVSTDFDEDRWVDRPESTLKYQFRVEVDLPRADLPGQSDTYDALLQYDPETATFRVESEQTSSAETKAARDAAGERVDERISSMLEGTLPLEDRFDCPFCGGTIVLTLTESESRAAFMRICGSASCDECGYGLELCGIRETDAVRRFLDAQSRRQ